LLVRAAIPIRFNLILTSRIDISLPQDPTPVVQTQGAAGAPVLHEDWPPLSVRAPNFNSFQFSLTPSATPGESNSRRPDPAWCRRAAIA
jgi:hypothetical protein